MPHSYRCKGGKTSCTVRSRLVGWHPNRVAYVYKRLKCPLLIDYAKNSGGLNRPSVLEVICDV